MSRSTQIFITVLVGIVLIGVGYAVTHQKRELAVAGPSAVANSADAPKTVEHIAVQPLPTLRSTSVRIGEARIIAELPTTDAEFETGLGGRTALAQDHGMLFSLGTPDYYEFWMKGMLFPIDIIWISGNKTVVDITPNLSPDSYPQTYAPKEPAQYVLEVPAGYAAANNINVGDKAAF